MLITHQREKLINAIIYFVEETSLCNKTKLFKLLYHLDFEHFMQTGRSVTGLDYFAWQRGPVPVDLNQEIEEPQPDMAQKLAFEIKTEKNGWQTLYIHTQAAFDSQWFSKRELALLKDIASRYFMESAAEMIDSTHLPTQPWARVYEQEKKKLHLIPYEYAVNDDPAILRAAQEHREMVAHYQ